MNSDKAKRKEPELTTLN